MKIVTCSSFIVGMLICLGSSGVYLHSEFVSYDLASTHHLIVRLYLTGIVLMVSGTGAHLFFDTFKKEM